MTSAGQDGRAAGPGGGHRPAARRLPIAYDPADPAELVVVVAAGCRSSDRSVRLLEDIAALRPDARLAVLDAAGPHPPPVSLIGTPTWVWRGRARWWGTPEMAEVVAVLDATTGGGPILDDGLAPVDGGPPRDGGRTRGRAGREGEEAG